MGELHVCIASRPLWKMWQRRATEWDSGKDWFPEGTSFKEADGLCLPSDFEGKHSQISVFLNSSCFNRP